MMMTNLEYYKVFYYVAVCQSMTLAAERLMISQPAVSQSMRQLEKALDTKLIVRCARGIRLTPASVSGSVSPEIPGDQSTCHERPDPRDIDVSERR